MYLVWEGGDWETLFRKSFGRVPDGSPSNIILNDEESHAYSELIKDNGTTVAWELLDEFVLKSVHLSSVSDKVLIWHPNWGIRKSDTITGVSKHDVDWSYHSLTPCDYKDFVSNSTIEGVEHLGAQAIAASNSNFQGALFQAKSWRTSSEANRIKLEKSEEEVKSLKEALARKEKELVEAQADLVELRKSNDDYIDEYLDSQEYKDLIEKHDEILFPVQYSAGWEDAVKAVSAKHPEAFDPTDFPTPHPPTPLYCLLAGTTDMEEDDRILDPVHSSPPCDTSVNDPEATDHTSGSSSGEETDTGSKGEGN
ncbi:hypothetical protein POM88_041685 [Heracleum sosnowskyi]|uniref:Uncharacterized protein n=1 Tax=Heracleum sosnowskyi TaxID=360622 RepID=A0AAD8MAZ4_9APIA|nr:hypothetical protein POM88_041685 [Heracleum sosnowskyi]